MINEQPRPVAASTPHAFCPCGSLTCSHLNGPFASAPSHASPNNVQDETGWHRKLSSHTDTADGSVSDFVEELGTPDVTAEELVNNTSINAKRMLSHEWKIYSVSWSDLLMFVKLAPHSHSHEMERRYCLMRRWFRVLRDVVATWFLHQSFVIVFVSLVATKDVWLIVAMLLAMYLPLPEILPHFC